MSDIISVGIVGRGIIGASWALVFARAGIRVRMWARNEDEIKSTLATVQHYVGALVGTGLEGDSATMDRISAHASLAETLEGVQYVQESVNENLNLKHDILRKIEACVSRETIIGSSTSGIMPGQLCECLRHPERFLVVHPLTPPHLLPITELCTSEKTSEHVVGVITSVLERIGQHPVRLKSEITGFALNRILGAMMNECFALIRDGVLDAKDVDPLLTEGFGLRWGIIGPLAAMDLNAPNGIGEYLRRYGGIYEVVARERGATPVLNDALIDDISRGLREHFDKEPVALRVARRDRGVAEVRAARKSFFSGFHQ